MSTSNAALTSSVHGLIPVCHLDFAAWRREKHGQAARARGACSPTCCGEKPPCLEAESVTGRPEGFDPGSFSEVFVEFWFLVFLALWNNKLVPRGFARTPSERGSVHALAPLSLAVYSEIKQLFTRSVREPPAFLFSKLGSCQSVLQ